MDPAAIATLTGSVLAVITPYVSKGAEEFAKLAGAAAFEKTKALFAAIKHRLSPDKEAADTLGRFEEKPQRYEPVLRDILAERLAKDPEFAAELERYVKEIGPVMEIVQRQKEAEGIVGFQGSEVSGGSVRVVQEMDKAKNVIGAKVDKFG